MKTTEKEYFSECVRECETGMYTLAMGILKNETDVADVMQDAILKAYCNLEQLKDRKRFRPWMLSIVHNTAIEYIRKRKDVVDIESLQELASPEQTVDVETKFTVWEAIQKLNLPYRTAIILFYYEDYSVRQIAEVTHTSVIAAKQHLSRGRKMLAKLLHKEDFTQ